jgi:hypothetical protein
LNSSRVAYGFVLAVLLTAGSASAVPAFARQTGMSCAQCHTIFPELTPFGRQFKVGAYTMAMQKQISEGGGEEKRLALELPAYVPLGAMLQVGYTHTADAAAVTGSESALNDNISIPQTFSLFYAGKIAPKVGAFAEVAYDGVAGTFGLDNTDVRFAHQFDVGGTPLTLGATLNNSPTVSDIYNSTPAWGFPALTSGFAPGPEAATLVEETLAFQVAGLGLYGSWNGNIYAEFALYRSAPQRVELPLDHVTGASTIIQGVMPYWRVAGEKTFGEHTVSVGTFGLHSALLPGDSHPLQDPVSPAVNTYTDIGVDAQYQWITEKHIVSGTVTYINESQSLTASHGFDTPEADNPTNDLHTFKVSANYIYDRLLQARVTFNTVRGSADDALWGGSPRTTAITSEVSVNPWLNTRIGVQYVAFLDLNGASGADAAKANTLYAYLWVAY